MSLKERSSSGDQHPHPSRVLLMQQLRFCSTLVFTYFLCSLKRCSSWQPRARSLSVTLSVSHSCVPASPYQRLLSPPVLISSADCLPFFIGKSPFNALVRHRSACWLFVFSLFLYLLFLFLLLLLYFVFLCARLFIGFFIGFLGACRSLSPDCSIFTRGSFCCSSSALLLLARFCRVLWRFPLPLKMFRSFRILF